MMPRVQIVNTKGQENLPSISEDQFNWLTYRMGVESDEYACDLTHVDPDVVLEWKEQPGFAEAYACVLENKRDGTEYLVTQLNGKALRKINQLLDSDSAKSILGAVTLLWRAQALLKDRNQVVDQGTLSALMSRMREESTIEALPGRK